jgi:hypothetical protein
MSRVEIDGMNFARISLSQLNPEEVTVSELPAMPLWDILYLNGISLVLTGVLVALLDEARGPDTWDELPPLSDPYAEI